MLMIYIIRLMKMDYIKSNYIIFLQMMKKEKNGVNQRNFKNNLFYRGRVFKMSYEKIAKDVLKSVGGEENITSVVHCATRLRFKLKDRKRVDKNETEGIEGVISVVESGGQYQVVIGNMVGDVYKEITKITKFGDDDTPQSSSSDGSIFNKTVDIIAGIFTPFLGALAASGILKGLLIMLDTAGILTADTGAYRIWFATADAIFYFLPLLIAVTSARKFGANIYVALGVAGALVHPNIIAMNTAGEAIDFFSIPVVMMSYTSSVIPVILAIWVLSIFEKWLNKKLHPNVKNFLTPLFSIMFVVPITLLVFGPFGTYLSQWLATGTTFIYDLSPIAAGIVMGIAWQILVIFGLHWAFIPIMYNNLAVQGFDKLKPLFAPSNFAQAGAALGVFLKTKNPKVKGIAGAAAVTGIFGITEPIIYGITLRYKKPFLWAALGGGLGGAIAGASGSVALAPGIPSVVTIPIFFGTGFAGFIAAIIVAYFFSAIATYFFGYNDSMENELASENQVKKR
jgi:PTS system beta-glucosides-specific IIC component